MYTCNITGKKFDLDDTEKDRELCVRFGHNSRFRAICYILTKMLYREVKIMSNLEVNKNIKGIGMSDSGWAGICKEKFDYINTFYHTEPYLDIYNKNHVDRYKNLDFIISSDVFEHIDPYPNIQYAFNNLYKMLKNEGFIVFTVPFYYGEHKEHFPNLYKYEIKKEDSNYILYNTTIDGKFEKFDNLCFHGGPGNILEMRLFSKNSIMTYLEKAGFKDITFHNITKDMNKYGIFWSKNNDNNCSLVITAKKSIYKHNNLFNKYILNISNPKKKLNYKIIFENEIISKYICHIHIYNLDLFFDIFGEYYELISKYFFIIITFCENKNQEILEKIKTNNLIILKIPNRGLDLGGKICCIDYLYKNNISYDNILFLHSKTNKDKRNNYILPFLKNEQRIKLIMQIIKIKTNILGIFPNNIFYKNKTATNFSNNGIFSVLENYFKDILDYLSCKNREILFVEGNVMILSKKVIDFIFKNKIEIFYNILNDNNSFDCNWVKHYYKLFDKSNDEIYNEYINNNLFGNNIQLMNTEKSSPNCMIEHIFERIWINVIKHLDGDFLVLDKENLLNYYNIKINAIYFPQFHETEENNEFWGKNFTEWTLLKDYNNKLGDKFDIYKPHKDIGYYDLSQVETLKKQIEIAEKYNINGFIIYHYWFNKNKKVLYKPLEYFLRDDIKFKFCISWANESWSKRWDGSEKNILIKQEYDDYIEHIQYLVNFFKKENYIKNNKGECLFYIYNISDIPDFYDMERIWKGELKKHNLKIQIIYTENSNAKNHNWGSYHNSYIFEPMYSCNYCHQDRDNKIIEKENFDYEYYVENNIMSEEIKNNKDLIYEDYLNVGYQNFFTVRSINNDYYRYFILDYEDMIKKYLNDDYNVKNKHLGLSLYWNNIVRRNNIPFMYIKNYDKINLEKMFLTLISLIVIKNINIYNDDIVGDNYIIINAWNEWNEQAVLEPNDITNYENLEIIYYVMKNL